MSLKSSNAIVRTAATRACRAHQAPRIRTFSPDRAKTSCSITLNKLSVRPVALRSTGRQEVHLSTRCRRS